MDDQSSTRAIARYKVASKNKKIIPDLRNTCHFCGRIGVIVKEFPRRSYGRCHYEAVLQSG